MSDRWIGKAHVDEVLFRAVVQSSCGEFGFWGRPHMNAERAKVDIKRLKAMAELYALFFSAKIEWEERP